MPSSTMISTFDIHMVRFPRFWPLVLQILSSSSTTVAFTTLLKQRHSYLPTTFTSSFCLRIHLNSTLSRRPSASSRRSSVATLNCTRTQATTTSTLSAVRWLKSHLKTRWVGLNMLGIDEIQNETYFIFHSSWKWSWQTQWEANDER